MLSYMIIKLSQYTTQSICLIGLVVLNDICEIFYHVTIRFIALIL